MTITNIRAQYPRNIITYMPAWMCGALSKTSVIISIAYIGERRPVFGPEQTVLEINDDGCGLTPEDFHKALRFVKEHKGRNINIHCHQGQQRSKTLANQLATVIPQYRVLEHRPDGVIYNTNPERFSRARIRTLNELLDDKAFRVTAKELAADTVNMRRAAKATVIFEDFDTLFQ